jgi:hypothetical protein
MASGTAFTNFGSHIDVSLVAKQPICTSCYERLAKVAMKAIMVEMDLDACGKMRTD